MLFQTLCHLPIALPIRQPNCCTTCPDRGLVSSVRTSLQQHCDNHYIPLHDCGRKRGPFYNPIDRPVGVNAVRQEKADHFGRSLADCLVEKDGIKTTPISGASGAEEEAIFERVGPIVLRWPKEEHVQVGLELSIELRDEQSVNDVVGAGKECRSARS